MSSNEGSGEKGMLVEVSRGEVTSDLKNERECDSLEGGEQHFRQRKH